INVASPSPTATALGAVTVVLFAPSLMKSGSEVAPGVSAARAMVMVLSPSIRLVLIRCLRIVFIVCPPVASPSITSVDYPALLAGVARHSPSHRQLPRHPHL